jgi:Kef-type K+ transport system membrane component KefB
LKRSATTLSMQLDSVLENGEACRHGQPSAIRLCLAALVFVLGLFSFSAQAQEHPAVNPGNGPQVPAASLATMVDTNILEVDEIAIAHSRADKPGLVETLPLLVRIMIGMTVVLVIPSVSRKCSLPPVVGLIVTGILCGPHVFGLMRHTAPALAVFAEMGRLLLLFYAGLEIDLALFKAAKWRATFFGVATCLFPLGFGVMLGLGFGYNLVAAFLIGSLLASHTLLGYPVVKRYDLLQREPVIVTVGATILTDTLSLVILAVCVSVHRTGFNPYHTTVQLVQIVIYMCVVLLGFGRLARWFFTKYQPERDVQMLVLLFIVSAAALLAEAIHLESIIGAFMAGLAVNRALRGTTTHDYI